MVLVHRVDEIMKKGSISTCTNNLDFVLNIIHNEFQLLHPFFIFIFLITEAVYFIIIPPWKDKPLKNI